MAHEMGGAKDSNFIKFRESWRVDLAHAKGRRWYNFVCGASYVGVKINKATMQKVNGMVRLARRHGNAC
jgi:hypothetical protein